MIVIDKRLNEYCKIYDYKTYSEYVENSIWSKKTHQKDCDYDLLKDEERSSLDKSREDWTGTRNFKEAIDLALFGWKEGMKYIKDKKVDQDLNKKSQKKIIVDPKNDVYGSYIDMGRYLMGRPDCMIRNVIKTKPSRIKIIVKYGFNSGSSKKDFLEFGKDIINLLDEIESKNVRVKLELRICAKTSRGGRENFMHRIIIKDYNNFLDINSIVFALCNASFFRRIGFANLERHPEADYYGFCKNSGYGRIEELVITKEEKEKCLCIDSITSEFDYKKYIID